MKTNSLITLIREQVREKNRPLKIICDWDECLITLKPFILHKALGSSEPFEKFFKDFWEEDNAEKYYTQNFVKGHSENTEEWQKVRKFVEEKTNSKNDPELYNKLPYLDIADDILCSLKEGLIERCVIISAFRKKESGYPPTGDPRKREKFARTFGNFPQCEIELTSTAENEEGKRSPQRWEIIKEKYSDFDIFIDDSKSIIQKTHALFPKMCIVTPDYKINRQVQGIYHLPVKISSLQDQDFINAILEMKNKQLEKGLIIQHQLQTKTLPK